MGDTTPSMPAVRRRDLGMLAPRELATELDTIADTIETKLHVHTAPCDCCRDEQGVENHASTCACRAVSAPLAEQTAELLADLAGVVAALRACITTEPDTPVELLSRYRVIWQTVALADSPTRAALVAEGQLEALDALNRPRLFVFDGRSEHEIDLQTGEALTRETE